ncbi:hypothetical protein OJF2_64770 [Aquisphaera giovannonii]|uniref:Uncharacterized protein n=1 Tax=Aquisphaera giovannonii TaxID=406548 RepID=A0A5B9WCU8_9BACT|nr:hypothetical protein OJF2_64770 [Aquisphaera giovannonii]
MRLDILPQDGRRRRETPWPKIVLGDDRLRPFTVGFMMDNARSLA